MGKLVKKGRSGEVARYINRTQAIRKLQVSLADFRRLCILKGIYPREPKHKKRVNKGSTAPTTFYYRKDIQFLAHEPLLASFRASHAFAKRMKKFVGKHEWTRVRALETQRPSWTLDRLVHERYPTFVDALRDLDDALSMIALFATLPKGATERNRGETAEQCRRLLREFEAAAMQDSALKKAFISIKGIYWQAEIAGQTITWIAPHEFATQLPNDVDFKVMSTFLEFYATLVGFVNFRLFSRLGWAYPVPAIERAIEQERPVLLAEAAGEVGAEEEEDTANSSAPSSPSIRKIFAGMTIFISREVPRASIAFIAQSMGARIGWAVGEASPFEENDTAITHQIVDRPQLGNMFMDRKYIQPQWLFDCLNAGKILDHRQYLIGQPLPPHLSPFANVEDDEAADTAILERQASGNAKAMYEDERRIIIAEEAASEDEQREKTAGSPKDTLAPMTAAQKKLAISMVPKKTKKLYERIQRSRGKAAAKTERLHKRKRDIAARKATISGK